MFRAFLIGIYEFRRSFTTHFHNYDMQLAYDRGRELAHKLTLRRFES